MKKVTTIKGWAIKSKNDQEYLDDDSMLPFSGSIKIFKLKRDAVADIKNAGTVEDEIPVKVELELREV